MAANLPAYQPLIKQSIDTVANNRQHALYKYFGGAAWDNYDQLFFCSCQTQPHEAESERRPVTGIVGAFFNDRCPTLAEKYEIYGKFGTGSKSYYFTPINMH